MRARHLLAVLILAAAFVAVFALRGARRESEHTAVVGQPTAAAIEHGVGTLELSRPTDDVRSPAQVRPEPQPAPPAFGALRARVVDAAGRPRAGVPVALLASGPEIPLATEVERSESAHPDGIATYSLDLRRKTLPEGTRFSVAIDLPLEPRVERDLGTWVPGETWQGGPVELVLGADDAAWLEPVRVQVVDRRGQPVAGAEVELVARQRLAPSDPIVCGQATTRGADGFAEISRARQRETHARYRLFQFALDYEARCPGPFVSVPSAAVPTRPSNDPVRIVLPPTASVVARVRRADGALVEEAARIGLEWFAPGADERTGWSTAQIEGGTARFERVGLGLELRLKASLSTATTRSAEARTAGPSNEGETVEVDLTLGAELPLLVGRLIGAYGEPAAGMPFRVSGLYHVTDADGRFAIPWQASAEPEFLRFEERDDPRLGAPPGWVPRYADGPFPAPSDDGRRLEVGDVVLEDVPIVVAGRVVDATGAPVKQAWLVITHVEGEGRDARWSNLGIPGVSRLGTEADGTFVARSLERTRRLRVSASQSRVGESETVEVDPGTRDVRLVLAPAEDLSVTRGRVRGQVLIDEDVPLLFLEVRLVGDANQSGAILAGGSLRCENVVPGTYRLELRTARTKWPLDAVDGIVVRAGETNDDPRLQRIDLRGRLRLLRLRLRGDAGVPVASTNVQFELPSARASLATDGEGRLIAIVRTEDPSVILSAEGFAPAEIAWSPAEQEVVLVRR